MKHCITMLLLLLVVTAAAFAQDSIIIRGTVTGDTKGYHKLIVYFNNGLPEDSAFIGADGGFRYSYAYRPGISATIYMEYDIKVRQRVFPFVVITDEPGELVVSDAEITRGLHSGELSGNKTAVDFLVLHRQYTEQQKQVREALAARFPGETSTDMAYRHASDSMLTVITTALVDSFVCAHADSYAAVAAMRTYSVHIGTDVIASIFHKLSDRQQATAAGKAMATHIAGLKQSAIGSKVQDFSLPMPDGSLFSFSSLKGKYVLIDFWASWCGPCKASFPYLKEQYAKYKGDKFEILGISIDQDKQAWLQELPKQQLPWLQALDNQNLARKAFAVVGVPTTYLISPEGVILLKEIGFQPKGEIQRQLQELSSR